MKGTSFQNGVEYKVTIEGESWQQSQSISGALQTVVRGNPPENLNPRVILAESTERRIKGKSKDAYTVLEEASGDGTKAWKFTVPRTARITDKAGSLYLLYGAGEDLNTLGMLRLNILPHHYLQDLIELMRTEFRFALKKVTMAKNGWIDVELDPPGSKDWAQLAHLVLSLQLTDETIEAEFLFKRAEVDGLKAGLSTKITERDIARSWSIGEMVHDFNDRLNKDAAETAINGVVEEYRAAGWLA